MKPHDWSQPQRQPAIGLAVVFLNTIWEVAKRFWPLLLLMLFGKEGKVSRYEIIALVFLVITILTALMRFLYFKFYIEDYKLVIKKGWLNKETKIIPLEKIQTVNIEQGPLHQLLNIVKVSIDTAGSQKAEATIESLHMSMAEDLRLQLLSQAAMGSTAETATAREPQPPLLQLGARDLMKLSVSANHLEAFFILLSFGFGLYENLKDLDNNLFSGMEDYLPEGSLFPLLFLIIVILMITVLVSTIRIVLKFYDFRMLRTENGYQIKSGLTNIKERLIGIRKIQFLSWKANWIRKLMGLWLLEYHVAGGDELKTNLKVQVPVTQTGFINTLVDDYHSVPDVKNLPAITMHPAFIVRRLLVLGLIPFLVATVSFWWALEWYVLFFLFYPLVITLIAWVVQKKFRMWAMEDVLFIRKGIFGQEWILARWPKLQAVSISQSLYQRQKGLANLSLSTAGGTITINFISLEAARALADYALYKVESSNTGWM